MISRDEFKSVLLDAIEGTIKKRATPIGEEEVFEDYGLDSLDRMNLLLELEDRLNFDLGDLDLSVINTPTLLYAAIENISSGN